MSEQTAAPADGQVPEAGRTAPAVTGARRIAVIVIIASLAVTALLGIIALVSGDFGDTQVRILLTTLAVAGFSITALCHLAVAGRPVRAVGFTGLAVSGVALILALLLTWIDWRNAGLSGELLRWFAVSAVAATSLAQANLLLLLASRRSTVVRIGLAITLAAIAGVALMIALPVLSDGEIPGPDGDVYWRLFGIIAILDALGTVVIPVAAVFVRDRPAAEPIRLPSELSARVERAAEERGTTRDALVAEAVERYLGSE